MTESVSLSSERLRDEIVRVIRIKSEADQKVGNTAVRERLGALIRSNDGQVPEQAGQPDPDDDVLMRGLQTLVALDAVRTFDAKFSAILRLRTLTRAAKAEWCRALAWHYAYVLRERVRRFLNAVIEYQSMIPTGEAAASCLPKAIASFKKRTDDVYFSERGRHVHQDQIDEPLLEQVHLLDMLTSDGSIPALRAQFERQARKVQHHVREKTGAILSYIDGEAESILVSTETIWAAVIHSFVADEGAA